MYRDAVGSEKIELFYVPLGFFAHADACVYTAAIYLNVQRFGEFADVFFYEKKISIFGTVLETDNWLTVLPHLPFRGTPKTDTYGIFGHLTVVVGFADGEISVFAYLLEQNEGLHPDTSVAVVAIGAFIALTAIRMLVGIDTT